MKKKPQLKTWKVEYEIPPLRAIYNAEADCLTEAHVRKLIGLKEPKWRIRKITLPAG